MMSACISEAATRTSATLCLAVSCRWSRASSQPSIESGSGRLQIARLDGEQGQSADRASDGEPHLEASLRKRHRAFNRQLRQDGRAADVIPNCSIISPAEFMASGWSVKAMHRMLVLSSAYQMSSARERVGRQESIRANKLLQHMPVRRLEAEAIRDSMLATAGTLDRDAVRPERAAAHQCSSRMAAESRRSGPLDGARPAEHLYPGASQLHDAVVRGVRLSVADQRDRGSNGLDRAVASADDDEQRVHRAAGIEVGRAA